jgi:hypothetical protein
MSVIDFLLGLVQDDDARAEYAEDPARYTAERLPENVTGADVLAALPEVCSQLPPEQAGPLLQAYGLSTAGSSAPAPAAATTPAPGSAPPPPPPPTPDPGATDLETAVQQINHFTNVYETVNQEYHDDDVNYDQSVNTNVNSLGDVDLDITNDNDIVTGDGAVAAGDHAQVNTGDGAVQAGDDIEDSLVNTGTIEDSNIVDGNVGAGAVLGDDNQTINAGGSVGAAAFGDGDATNVGEGNAVVGDDNILVDDNTGNIGFGSGDVIDVDDSNLSESVIGDGTVQSNDVDITADDGSSVAFGEGSTSEATTTDVDIDDSTIDGNLQVAGGDDATQAAVNDESINDSGNVTDSFNSTYTDNSSYVDASDDDGTDFDNSANTDDSFNVDDNSYSDDDGIDIG